MGKRSSPPRAIERGERVCSEWKMASSSSSSSSRRKKQEVALARTDDYADHYEDEEVESSMLQARGLGAVTQGMRKSK